MDGWIYKNGWYELNAFNKKTKTFRNKNIFYKEYIVFNYFIYFSDRKKEERKSAWHSHLKPYTARVGVIHNLYQLTYLLVNDNTIDSGN